MTFTDAGPGYDQKFDEKSKSNYTIMRLITSSSIWLHDNEHTDNQEKMILRPGVRNLLFQTG